MYASYDDVQFLTDNMDIVEIIGQLLDLKPSGKNYKALCPFHQEKNPSFIVFPETSTWHCFGCGEGGNIITFLRKYYKISFKEAVEYLSKYMQGNSQSLINVARSVYTLKKLNSMITSKNEKIKNIPIEEDFLNQFRPYIVQEWVDEGISAETQKKYDIRICKKRCRWLIPVRDENNDLVVIIGRTYLPDWQKLGVQKYVYIKPEGYKFVNNVLFGLNFNFNYIKNNNEVIVFEAHKSVMKADSMGIYNAVAVGTSCINNYQVDKLLSLQCNVVLALDKDVSLDRVKREADKLKKFTNVYIIYDFDNLLDEKDAPVDKGKEVFMELYKKRIRI